jgi:hypothetical protein
MTEFAYIGDELTLFAEAENWKRYWSKMLAPYILGDVIEVGAGIATSTPYLITKAHPSWLCLEPDPALSSEIAHARAAGRIPDYCVAQTGILKDLAPNPQADTITYIDVLEHIEQDENELDIAAARLRPEGRIVILAPAFNAAFSPFDHAVGHFRRYSKADLARLTRRGLMVDTAFYLDGLGLCLSLANRLMLRSHLPTRAQIRFWDRRIIPISILTDHMTRATFGRSLVLVLRKY